MFSALRTRYGIPGVIATVALVFAMTGGAFAAKYLITSTKQIKPSVLKKLKGKTGPAGPAGAAGLAGAKGDTGAAGVNGEKGAQGEEGEEGADGTSVTTAVEPPLGECGEQEGVELTSASGVNYVCNGANGAPGTNGQPWTPDNELPGNATLTGAWSLHTDPAERIAAINNLVTAPISFALPVDPGPTPHYSTEASFADFDGGGPGTQGCTGSAAAPTAPSGHLCVYETIAVNLSLVGITGTTLAGPTKSGALIAFMFTNTANPGAAMGSYAVTG